MKSELTMNMKNLSWMVIALSMWLPSIILPSITHAQTEYQGYVEGDYLWIGLIEGGVVNRLMVERGDNVVAGQALFSLNDEREVARLKVATAKLTQAKALMRDLEKGMRDSEISAIMARLEQAQAAQELASQTLERQLSLQDTGAASPQNLDTAQANYNLAKAHVNELQSDLITARLGARDDILLSKLAEVESLQAQVDEATWSFNQRHAFAPEAGFIEDVFYRVGEFIPNGRAGVSLLPPENIKIRFFVAEGDFAKVKIGQTVAVSCDGCERGLKSVVSYISSQAEFTPPVIYSENVRDKLMFMVEARSNQLTLKPGQLVDVVLK
jgi:HlyD family secretion protein